MKIKLTNIRVDGGTQPREKINQEIVEEYADLVKSLVTLPPVEVIYDGHTYWLADGFHRFFAHQRAGRDEIEANTRDGSQRDAILWSLRANHDHGLRRTIEDKRRAVMVLLNDMEWENLSLREMADICKVSHPFVSKVKNSLHKPQSGELKIQKPEPKSKHPIENKVLDEGPTDDDKLRELAIHHEELAEENARLMDRLSVKHFDATPEEKVKALETLEELRKTVKQQEAEIKALKVSRDQYQNKCAELIKQCAYWEKLAKKN